MLGKKKQKPRRPAGHFDTLVSSRTTVKGDVHFSGGLHVDGTIRGRVVAEEGGDAVLRLSEVGSVEGDIVAPHVIVNGTVHGDVYASTHLELAEKASIHGNVYYNLIEMAMGASVNGSLVHQNEPVGLLSRDKQPDAIGDAVSEEKPEEKESMGVSGKE
ncbi:polymer-forming cytoskeletal protein [Marinobacter sp.]|jgi:cytoskeletal protein CcmA (bactofilin family)|uniref:bactofilin family protein n=1 Tax=Marinobacter sp. TaxID=50741 RepID=UPI000C43B92F|nr:polymer-forming cytoskeletal protein [Marinobacter sp.]MBE94649.1 cell shape determination protein CcmA [Marinobacter sp.]MBP54589.1 cell shape determination protein CcmA [Marinobacter sp.]|tara:strand:- start:34 stop:510 length:477 start_codon:yes stop_codon:yes gene_type:complete